MRISNSRIIWLLTAALCCVFSRSLGQTQHISRQGQVTFFSYTKVENIQATNNQVLSLFNEETGEIAVTMLMRAFSFKKALMQEHFNESYIESDLYPKANFSGNIEDFDTQSVDIQTRLIKGDFQLRDVTRQVEIKAQIARDRQSSSYIVSGELVLDIDDYQIKVPALLKPNIAKAIKVQFNFQYSPYEE